MENNKKTSFVMYPADFLAAVHNFRKNDTADLIVAICEFNLYGDTSVKLSGLKKDRFDSIQHVITLHNERWLQMCEINAQNAKKGASHRKATAKQTLSEHPCASASGRQQESEKENEKENESDTEMDNDCRERDVPSVDNSGFVGAPTVEEVAEYCRENGYTIDVVAFVNWHNARGWMHGKRYIALEWRTAVQKWFCKEIGITYSEFKSAGFVAATVLEQAKEAHHD